MNHLNLGQNFEINGESHGTYNTNSQIKFKIWMLNLSLCDYSDVYVLLKEIIMITAGPPYAADANQQEIKAIKD